MYQAMAVLSRPVWIFAQVGVSCLKPSSQRSPSAAAVAQSAAAAASPRIADRRMRFLLEDARSGVSGPAPPGGKGIRLFRDDELLQELLGRVRPHDDGILGLEAEGLVVGEDHGAVIEEDVQAALVVARA